MEQQKKKINCLSIIVIIISFERNVLIGLFIKLLLLFRAGIILVFCEFNILEYILSIIPYLIIYEIIYNN